MEVLREQNETDEIDMLSHKSAIQKQCTRLKLTELICLMDSCITLIQGEYKMKVAVSLLTPMMLTAGL